MNKTAKLGICILFLIIFVFIVYAVPLISIIQPSANTTTTNTSIIINISITEASLKSANFTFNQSVWLWEFDGNGSLNNPWNLTSRNLSSCYEYKNYFDMGDGYYMIRTNSTYSAKVYCDQTDDLGGWTRLNSQVSTPSVAYGGSDIINTNNVGQACGGTSNVFTINNILVNQTKFRVYLNRTTTIGQCPSIVGSTSNVNYYWNVSLNSWVQNGVCTWGDFIWARACCVDFSTTGLQLYWKKIAISGLTSLTWRSECSGASDNGAFYYQIWSTNNYTLNLPVLRKISNNTFNIYYNASNLSIGNYTYSASAKDIAGNSNSTGIRTLTVLAIIPQIYFTAPTPANATTTTNTSVIINVSVIGQKLNEYKWNWNGTNYTFYNDSLVLMYNFDNVSAIGDSGTKTVDVSKNKNDGTCTNFVSSCNYTTGKYGNAVQFDGSNDYVTASNPITSASQPFSIGAWVNLDTIKTASAWYYEGIVTQGATKISMRRNIANDKQEILYFEVGWWPNQVSIEGPILQANKWYYMVGTYNGSSVMNLYLDGNNVGSASGATWADLGSFSIGRDSSNQGFTESYLDGRVDEVRIYNRVLSADEVKQLYNSNFNKYDTDKWLFYTNQSNLTKGSIYTYLASAKDSAGNQNQTEKIYLTIQSGTMPTINTNIFSTLYGSTDFNNVANLNNVTNMVLATQYGKVKWTNGVNVSSQDIDKSVKIGSGFVSINASALHNTFNTSAKVNISVLSCDEWTIYYSNQTISSLSELKIVGQQVGNGTGATGTCTSQCSNPTCSDNMISFDAAHFDSFGGEGNPTGEVPVPEFSTLAMLLALTITIIGFFMVRKR